MREYELIIDKALTRGLSPELMPVNAEFLSQCLGFRCGKARLESHVLLTDPIPATVDKYYNWPFPQFLVGDAFNILVIRDTVNQQDSVYSVSADHLTITHIFDVDELTFGKGTLMEFADFGVCFYDQRSYNHSLESNFECVDSFSSNCNYSTDEDHL